MNADELVPVMVPRSVLSDVYKLLGGANVAGQDGVEHTGVAGDWPDDLLRRAVEDSPPGMRVIFEALAQNPGRWLTAEDLAEALQVRLPEHGGPSKPNADWNTVAGTLGAFGRRARNRYNSDQVAWPFEVRYDYERGRYSYRMSDHTAARVMEYL